MTLGMGKRKISRILVMETFIVGVISLISWTYTWNWSITRIIYIYIKVI